MSDIHVEEPLHPEQVKPRFVTLRAMAIACALMPVLALWVVNSELIWWNGASTAISLFSHVMFPIFFLSLLNLYLEKRYPRIAFSPGELMTVYVMLSVAGTICSHDFLQILVPMLGFPAYNANPQNRWDELLLPHIPSWSILTDRGAYEGLAIGNDTLLSKQNLLAWAPLVLFWGGFILVMMVALLCLNVLLRKQWTEKERLSFPVIQIPLMVTSKLRDLLTNRFFWLAFCLAAAIDILNGFNFFYPSLPKIPIENAFYFSDYLVERPWNAIANTTLSLYPFVIGLSFFLPTDLAFSCWFFYLLFKIELVVAASLGIQDLPGFPFPNEQAAGGYLGLGLLAIWLSRRQLRGAICTAFGLPGGMDDKEEPMRYRTALIGFVVCFFLLVSAGVLLGSSWKVMIPFFIIFFLYALAIARMRAELGPPGHDLHYTGPDILIWNAAGSRNLSDGTFATFSLFYWFNRAYRAHFSAHSMEGFKVAHLNRIATRSMMIAMVVAVVVGTLAAFWGTLHNMYTYGYSGYVVGMAYSSETWNRMAGWVGLPEGPRYGATAATGIGMFLTLLLGALRMKFTWWLWHPVGYATCSSWSMERIWFCVFIAWLARALITRYGGAPSYRKAIPFFVGLVLGEFIIGQLWSIYGGIMGIPVYRMWG